MIQLSSGWALALAIAAPVAVVGWAAIFGVESALRGPRWALAHLTKAVVVFGLLVVAGLAAMFGVRPVWAGFAVLYPLATGAMLAWGRKRQLAILSREIGFEEIDPLFRARLLARLTRGLSVLGVIATGIGLGLVWAGAPQGWILVGLAAIIGWGMVRARADQVGSALPPSL